MMAGISGGARTFVALLLSATFLATATVRAQADPIDRRAQRLSVLARLMPTRIDMFPQGEIEHDRASYRFEGCSIFMKASNELGPASPSAPSPPRYRVEFQEYAASAAWNVKASGALMSGSFNLTQIDLSTLHLDAYDGPQPLGFAIYPRAGSFAFETRYGAASFEIALAAAVTECQGRDASALVRDAELGR